MGLVSGLLRCLLLLIADPNNDRLLSAVPGSRNQLLANQAIGTIDEGCSRSRAFAHQGSQIPEQTGLTKTQDRSGQLDDDDFAVPLAVP